DAKDMKILKELDSNADITIRQLARNVRMSHQVVEYRIKKMMEDKIISDITSWIDMGKIGYLFFRVHFRFKSITKEKRDEFENYIFSNKKCFYMSTLSGKWDSYIDIFAKSPLDFEKQIEEITNEFQKDIQDYETLLVSRLYVFNYKYLFEQSERSPIREFVMFESFSEEKIDDIDRKILKILAKNSRKPYLQIANDVGLSRSSVKERIKKMHERKIILKNRMNLNFNALGKNSFKVFFKIRGNVEEKKKLINYARMNKNIIFVLEIMGPYQLDFEIQIESMEKLQDLLIEIRNNFPIIHDYEILSLLKDTGTDYYPIEKGEYAK
ncbi:MAG TPA: Lrp/AsnC family transcriptional regulator, partial [bacterium]|nr:Lrp/AsnC family transcriptional regulator [bacterium]